MFNLLVVDDELFAVKGISVGIDWSDTPIKEVFEACDYETACELMSGQAMDIAILDIEMPGHSGLELAEWIHEHSPQTEVIFLTGHANFAYAQRAMQMEAFRYVLKPVDHDELKRIVEEAAGKIREQVTFQNSYSKYSKLWDSQKPLLIERFWQDVMNGRISLLPERLDNALTQYDIPLGAGGYVIPVLISVEQWKEALNLRDEEIMEYAVRKAAEEMVLDRNPGSVVSDRSGINLILLYAGATPFLQSADLKRRCGQYIGFCNEYFHCSLSCYIGDPVVIKDLSATYRALLSMERDNVTRTNGVFQQSDGGMRPLRPLSQPMFDEWAGLFETGHRQELLLKIDRYFQVMGETGATHEMLEDFYYGFVSMVYQVAERKGIPAYKLLSGQSAPQGNTPTKSIGTLRTTVHRIVDRGAEEFLTAGGQVSSVVSSVMAYVEAHLHEEFSREEVAASVFLNPAYLSRLFRKETGLSMTEYIFKTKMERAKQLLAQSNDKVVHIAEAVGYGHLSYFAKQFKKFTGYSPHEYRRAFKKI